MADQTGMVVKVQTERLISTAGEVETKIRRLEEAFAAMEQTVNTSRRYWEGDGMTAYQAAYRQKKGTIETAFRRFRENVTDLYQIADVYEQSERAIT